MSNGCKYYINQLKLNQYLLYPQQKLVQSNLTCQYPPRADRKRGECQGRELFLNKHKNSMQQRPQQQKQIARTTARTTRRTKTTTKTKTKTRGRRRRRTTTTTTTPTTTATTATTPVTLSCLKAFFVCTHYRPQKNWGPVTV